MEIKVLEKGKNRLKFEIIGETHTLPNVLTKELWNTQGVTVSGYQMEHPLVSNPVILLETEGKDPKKVLQNTIERLKKQNKEFLKKFKKISKN